MKKISFYGMVLLALSLTACTQDELQDNPLADGPVALNVTAGISQVATRVSIEGNTAAFTNGDQINVVADGNETHVYTLQGSSWSAGDNPYYFQNTGNVNFRAWYADPGITPTGNVIFIDTRTQTIDETTGWNKWDILATPAVQTNVHSSTVNFTGNNAFQHVMSQVTLVFETGAGISNLEALSGYTLKSLVTNAFFNTRFCTVSPSPTTADMTANITDASGTSYTCTPLILVPQAITGTIGLEVTYNNQTYKAALNAPEGSYLNAGYSYTYNVTISNTGLTVSGAEIENWETNPNFNGEGTATLQ